MGMPDQVARSLGLYIIVGPCKGTTHTRVVDPCILVSNVGHVMAITTQSMAAIGLSSPFDAPVGRGKYPRKSVITIAGGPTKLLTPIYAPFCLPSTKDLKERSSLIKRDAKHVTCENGPKTRHIS